MPATEFQARFTADAAGFRQELADMRRNVGDAVSSIRSQFAALAAISFAGIGVKELVQDCIALGAAMQQTRTAFAVMLGDAEKANGVLAELNRFADVTPFDNASVIQAGRALLSSGVAAKDLGDRLTMLGDIAAGTGTTIQDITLLYTDMMLKGKADAQDLKQLTTRGINVWAALEKAVGKTRDEIDAVSFAQVEKALRSLSAEGGQFAGMMQRQSETVAGKWSTLQAAFASVGAEIGEKALPAIAQAVQGLLDRIQELRESGQLDEFASSAASALASMANALSRLVEFVIRYKDQIASVAKGALLIGLASRFNALVQTISGNLASLARYGAALQAAGAAGQAAGAAAQTAAASMGALQTACGGVASALSAVGSVAAATAFVGWQIGTVLRELLDLDEVFTRIILDFQGVKDKGVVKGDAPEFTRPKNRLLEAAKEREKLAAEESRLAPAAKNAKDGAAATRLAEVKNRIQDLDKEIEGLLKPVEAKIKAPRRPVEADDADDARIVLSPVGSVDDGQLANDQDEEDRQKAVREAGWRRLDQTEYAEWMTRSAAEREAENATRQKGLRKKLDREAPGAEYDRKRKAIEDHYNELKEEIEAAGFAPEEEKGLIKGARAAADEELRKLADQRELALAKAAGDERKVREISDRQTLRQLIDAGVEQAAAQKAIDERRVREARETAEKVAKARQAAADKEAQAQKTLLQARQRLSGMADQRSLDAANERASDAQKTLSKAERRLASFGFSTVKKARKDALDSSIAQKIAAAASGEKVSFTPEERRRMRQRDKAERDARDARRKERKERESAEKLRKEIEKKRESLEFQAAQVELAAARQRLANARAELRKLQGKDEAGDKDAGKKPKGQGRGRQADITPQRAEESQYLERMARESRRAAKEAENKANLERGDRNRAAGITSALINAQREAQRRFNQQEGTPIDYFDWEVPTGDTKASNVPQLSFSALVQAVLKLGQRTFVVK